MLPGIKLSTEKLGNIKDQLAQNSQVTLTSKTKVYAANSAFTLKYLPTGSQEEEEIVVPALHTLTLSKPVRVTSLQGDAYVTL